ncbi:MAG TPA: tetratricopeptide repeat protein, partial [Pilimelia sp.]|nr:tetratricopeptide repeat protein [Pilimelia sp.]
MPDGVGNLPAALDGLIGRRPELARLRELHRSARLVTLRGPGGAGKTRLAVEFANRVRTAYPGGVWLVELGSLRNPALLTQTVATALRVREKPGQALLATIAAALTGRRVLLVLDDCEHLVEACAHLVHPLLSTCPDLTVMATSREALDVPGETIVRVGALSLPRSMGLPRSIDAATRAELLRSDAVRLFVERAGGARPGFEPTAGNVATIAGICSRLDGNALAIELAARRVRTLPVDDIAARLDDRFRLLTDGGDLSRGRHRDLRTAIEWSYELLDDDEKAVFRRLSVLAGGVDMDGASAVCAQGDLPEPAVIDLIAGLEAKSLVAVNTDGGRIRQLESIRLYAYERLVAAGEEAATGRRMLDWLTAKAERFARRPFPTADILSELDAERDNLLAALGRAHGESRLLLAAALARCWREAGHFGQGRALLHDVLANTTTSVGHRSTALVQAAYLATAGGDLEQARRLAEEAVAVDRAAHQPAMLARALTALVTVHIAAGDHHTSLTYARQALDLVRAAGDPWDIAVCMHSVAYVALHVGELDEAEALLAESLPVYRIRGEPWLRIGALHTAGMLALERGDLDTAEAYFSEGLEVPARHPARKMGVTEGLAIVAARQGRARRALRLTAATAELRRTWGMAPDATWWTLVEAATAQAGETLDAADIRQALAAGRAMTAEQALAYARDDRWADG